MKSFKKIAAVTLAVAMLCSFTALGATVEITSASVTDGVASIEYTSDASQVTALVYSGTSLSGANLVYVDQLVGGSNIPALKLSDYGKHTVAMGGIDVAVADTEEINYDDTTTTYALTLPEGVTGGTLDHDYTGDVANVAENTEINFKIIPWLGYELTSFMVGGEQNVGNVVNGAYKLTMTGPTSIAVTFSPIVADENGEAQTFGGVYEIAGEKTDNPKDEGKSMLTFGSAATVDGKVATNMGIYLETADGTPVTSRGSNVGPYFKAVNPTASNMYGIRFFELEAGTYKAYAYVEYTNLATGELEAPVKGEAVVFTVQ